MAEQHPITPPPEPKPMNIDEAKALKAALAQDIEKLLTNFTDTTGTAVESVYVERPTVMGPRLSYIVTVEVRL